jgi:deoxyadenosine/deoxycytidine kinase
MGQLISIIGNTGAGKTTLAHALCATGRFIPAYEQHAERPFQALFAEDLRRYALPNQVDYMLLRAEQEAAVRDAGNAGIVDGGLEQDFFIYTRLFFRRGYLNGEEYLLCERLYRALRRLLPAPDLFIYLTAPQALLSERLTIRDRALEIAQVADIPQIEELLHKWLDKERPTSLLTIDSAQDTDHFTQRLPTILSAIDHVLQPSHTPGLGG